MNFTTIILALLVLVSGAIAWWPASTQARDTTIVDRYVGVELSVAHDDIDIDTVTGSAGGEVLDAVSGEISALMDRVHRIEVVAWNESANRSDLLAVERSDQGWVLASAYDYPADAEEVIARSAARALGVQKVRKVGSEASRHAEYGLIDPAASDALLSDYHDIGRRVRMVADSGEVLVDVLIGRNEPGRAGHHYVREGNDVAVYTAPLAPSFSARFIDWVNPDPFGLVVEDVLLLDAINYQIDTTIDPQSGQPVDQMIEGERVSVLLDGEQWRPVQPRDGMQIDADAMLRILGRLGDMRLVDVELHNGDHGRFGFFVRYNQARVEEAVFGRAGAFHLQTKDGLYYSFVFGTVAGSATAEAGSEEPASADGAPADRYLLVRTDYLPHQDQSMPSAESLAAAQGADSIDQEAIDAATVAAARQAHVARREAALADLRARHQRFIYVIRDADYQTIRPNPDSLYTSEASGSGGASGGAGEVPPFLRQP